MENSEKSIAQQEAVQEAAAAREMEMSAEKIPSPADFIEGLKDQGLSGHATAYAKASEIAESVRENGGRALLIGGFVRDLYFGKISKDIDLEVYGLPVDRLQEVVSQHGKVKDVGRSFGVLKVGLGKEVGVDLDVSLPRRDSKVGKGHKGIQADVDPNMSIEEAAKRRDFTMNSIAADILTGEIFDPYGGVADIKKRRLRVTDEVQFSEDPLRVLRALQFTGRFGLEPDEECEKVLRDTIALPEFAEQSPERIIEEWGKLLLKSEKPSLGLQLGMRLGVFEKIHPEIQALAEIPQDPLWHPEGDVWMHTLKVVDEAAEICQREELDSETSFIVMISSLCHDFGKATTTAKKDGRYISHGHEAAGEEPTRSFLKSIGAGKLLTEKVVSLVVNHLRPTLLYSDNEFRGQQVSDGAIRRLAQRISPATIRELVLVAEADHMGRGPFDTPESREALMLPTDTYPPRDWLLERARDLAVEDSKPADLTRGKDWIAFGFKPGKEFRNLITLANDLRDDKGFSKEEVFQKVAGAQNPAEAVAIMQESLDK